MICGGAYVWLEGCTGVCEGEREERECGRSKLLLFEEDNFRVELHVVHVHMSTSNVRVCVSVRVCVHRGGSGVGGGFRPIIKEFSPPARSSSRHFYAFLFSGPLQPSPEM